MQDAGPPMYGPFLDVEQAPNEVTAWATASQHKHCKFFIAACVLLLYTSCMSYNVIPSEFNFFCSVLLRFICDRLGLARFFNVTLK